MTVCVSVAVHVDDSVPLLLRAMRSCVEQSADTVLWVQVDGVDPERMVSIVEAEAKNLGRYSGMKVVVRSHHEQGGGAMCRNEALAWMEPDWLVVNLDSDDWLPPGSLVSRMEALTPGMLWSAGALAHTVGAERHIVSHDLNVGVNHPDVVKTKLMSECGLPAHPCFLTPVRAWWDIGGIIGLGYGKEMVALSRLVTNGPGRIIDDVVYEYERLPKGESSKRPKTHHMDRVATRERWRRITLGLEPDSIDYDAASNLI